MSEYNIGKDIRELQTQVAELSRQVNAIIQHLENTKPKENESVR